MDATQRTITVYVTGPSSGGALATLSNGSSCTTVSGTSCTIANVPDGTYTLRGSATGYTTTTSAEFTTSSSKTSETVDLPVATRSITFTSNFGGATITVSSGENCVTATSSALTCSISGLALTTLSYTASLTGYVTQTDISINSSTTTASVTLVATVTYGLVVTVTGRTVTTESILVTVSGGYSCSIAAGSTVSPTCTVTVPAGSYTARATTATRQGSNTVTVSPSVLTVSIPIS